jgi:hypothetical protein
MHMCVRSINFLSLQLNFGAVQTLRYFFIFFILLYYHTECKMIFFQNLPLDMHVHYI